MSLTGDIAACNLEAARALAAGLVDAGVRRAVLAPGARSGPLAIALDEREDVEGFVVTDERSAGFFALGIARYGEEPVVLLCTSGTAAANFLPAVAEASLAELPLVVLTADRPPEARGFGAPQTIRQTDLFRAHARTSMETPAPSVEGPPPSYYRAVAARLAVHALGTPRGPAHLNVPLREPLLPVPLPPRGARAASLLRATVGELRVPAERLAALARRARETERGLLVCGPSSRFRTVAPLLAALARELGWPVLADPLSGARCEGLHADLVVEPHDAVLRAEQFCGAHRPELILRFGTLPTSKALRTALSRWGGEQLTVAGPAEWPDPDWTASEVVVCDAPAAIRDLTAELERLPRSAAGDAADAAARWLRAWRGAAAVARSVFPARAAQDAFELEGEVASVLLRALPAGTVLVVGNSMPVRDVDLFCTGIPAGLTMLGNRGANGIDGIVSTAVGAAVASRAPTAVLLGDLSFLHDASALRLARSHRVPLLVVVVNNDGGGIFHTLPCAGLGETFERVFATPHGADLRSAAALGGFRATRVGTGEQLEREIHAWVSAPQPLLLEAVFDRAATAARRKRLLDSASASVDERASLRG